MRWKPPPYWCIWCFRLSGLGWDEREALCRHQQHSPQLMGTRMWPSAPHPREQHQVQVSRCTEEVGYSSWCNTWGREWVSPVSRCMWLVTSPPRAYFSPCLLCLPYRLGLRLPGEEPTPALHKAPRRPGCTWVSRSKIKQLQIVTLIFGNFMQKFCFSSKLKVND